nr:uncharacterized protein LOC115254761 [Aedes albopictus]
MDLDEILLMSSGDENATSSDTNVVKAAVKDVMEESVSNNTALLLETSKRVATTPKANLDKTSRNEVLKIIITTENSMINDDFVKNLLNSLSALQDDVPLTDHQPKFNGFGIAQGELWIEAADVTSLSWVKNALEKLCCTLDRKFVVNNDAPLQRMIGTILDYGPDRLV